MNVMIQQRGKVVQFCYGLVSPHLLFMRSKLTLGALDQVSSPELYGSRTSSLSEPARVSSIAESMLSWLPPTEVQSDSGAEEDALEKLNWEN